MVMKKQQALRGIYPDLANILGKQRLHELSGLARLRRLWAKVVGDMLASRTDPLFLKPGGDGSHILVIAVTHSTMAQEIVFLRDHIRRACFEHAGIGRIAKIYTEVHTHAGLKEEVAAVTMHPISWQQKKQLAKELANIKDGTLRRAMFKARLAQLTYQKEIE